MLNNINSEIKSQLILAIGTIIVVMTMTAGLVIFIDEPFLGTWGALFFIACVPAQVLLGIWKNSGYPVVLTKVRQPLKGLGYLLITILIGLLVSTLVFVVVGGSIWLPRPPVIHYIIVTVVVTFWYVIVWQCWPVSLIKKNNPFLQFVIMYFVVYGFGYLVFDSLFNFDFLRGTEIYVAEIDPGGIFNAWYAVSFLVTTVSVIFALVLLENWPVSIWLKPDRMFLWGALNTLIVLSVSSLIYGVVIFYLDVDPVKYLIHGPVTFIFGVFIPLNLFEGKLYKLRLQPVKGIMLLLVSVICGYLLNKLYFGFPGVLLNEKTSGFPTYELELWVANAMLAFSFPVLVAFTDHFNFWPLRLSKSPD